MSETTDMTKKFTEFFYSPRNTKNGKVLVVSKYTERIRVNICLLKFFLHEMKQRGIFITVDRPHQYTASLLALHGISQENLVYIDAVSRISGETESNVSNVRFINGPYDMNFLDDITSISYAAGAVKCHIINLDDIDFVLIDDIAALTKYQDSDGVRKMIYSYMSTIDELNDVTAPIVLDVNKNRALYEIIIKNCERVLFINLAKSIFKELGNKKNCILSPLKHRADANLVMPALTGGY